MIQLISQMRHNHGGIQLRVGDTFSVATEAEAADLIAVRAATRAPVAKTAPVAQQITTRTMGADESSPEEDDTGPVLEAPVDAAEKSEEDKAKERAVREQEARERMSGKHGQHLRRDMRARR